MTATDWDGESYCTHQGCGNEACHSVLTGMVGVIPLYELVCCVHAPHTMTPFDVFRYEKLADRLHDWATDSGTAWDDGGRVDEVPARLLAEASTAIHELLRLALPHVRMLGDDT